MTPKRILVATDFSPAADLAVRRAAALAARFKAALRVVHAVPPLGMLEGLLPSRRHWSESVSAQAAGALKERVARTDKSIRVSTGLLVGQASVAIAAAVKDYKPDLLVIGARGEGRPSGAKSGLGGTAYKLVRGTRVPLLLVRRPGSNVPRRVLAALDLTPASSKVVRWAHGLAAPGRLTAVHVFEAPFASRLQAYGVSSKAIDVYAADERAEREREMHALLGRLGMRDEVDAHVLRGSAVKTITARLRSLDIDTLVVGQHGRRKRNAAVPYGSACHYLTQFTSVDVLVVP